jgi:hypothetical protein
VHQGHHGVQVLWGGDRAGWGGRWRDESAWEKCIVVGTAALVSPQRRCTRDITGFRSCGEGTEQGVG